MEKQLWKFLSVEFQITNSPLKICIATEVDDANAVALTLPLKSMRNNPTDMDGNKYHWKQKNLKMF